MYALAPPLNLVEIPLEAIRLRLDLQDLANPLLRDTPAKAALHIGIIGNRPEGPPKPPEPMDRAHGVGL